LITENVGKVFPQPSRDDFCQVYNYYLLDAASVLAVEALDVKMGQSILDLCAAPGGKSLAILQALKMQDLKVSISGMKGENEEMGNFNFELVCNENSIPRRKRLQKVIKDYVPDEFRNMILITGKDGTDISELEENHFDRVIVDSPCSSERHLIQNEEEFYKWNHSRTKVNAQKQIELLKTALHAVKVGGKVLYATCSISQFENDMVIEKILQKRSFKLEVVRNNFQIGESTKYGWIILPDVCDGWGPLYFCTIVKNQSEQMEENNDDEMNEINDTLDEQNDDSNENNEV